MNWTPIEIRNIGLGGFCPVYWKTTYSGVGNKNQAGAMDNCDLTCPDFITQGKGLATITGTVDQLIKGIVPNVVTADKTYGFGGTKLYEITATAITAKRTIAGASGEDVVLFAGHLKYIYGTDIGDFDLNATYDDDWGTAVAGFSALTAGVPHQAIVAGTTGLLLIINGSVIATWNGAVATDDAFDTEDTDIVLVSIAWNLNRFWIAGNKPNASGRNEASIFVWDGNSPSWENRIKIDGRIGALFVNRGVTYVFYQRNISAGVCTLGYIDGNIVRDLKDYHGSLPNFYQVTEYEGFIIWVSGTDVFAFGDGGGSNARLFQLCVCGAGGLANPFGAPITASANKLEKFNNYLVATTWKSMLFNVTGNQNKSFVDEIAFTFEKLATGARVDFILRNNKGTSLKTGTISFAGDGAITFKKFYPKCECENFRIELSWANGSATNPVSIRSIIINGHTL